jgi:tRNA-splicing ligase RtcB
MMQLIDGKIPVFGEADEKTLNQIRTCAKTADKVALMPDNHLGYGVPIGGVVAYKDAISPTGVGYDIGCGNKAVRVDMTGTELRANIKTIMDDVWKTISFGVGRKNNEKVDSSVLWEDFAHADAWKLAACKPLHQKAVVQLGTVGSGNHYVDLFTDEQDRVWIGVHFGSRGLGHGIATWFLKAAGAKDGMEVEPCVLDVKSDLGDQYLLAMHLAGAYAYSGRDWVCDRVAKILGAPVIEEVHNHHNYAWREFHGGEWYWVVRKGATPAYPGRKGFVGGSMGEQSVILEGVENENAKYSLYSTVHGAGRAMGRKEATGVTKKNKETGEVRVVREGKVTQEMMRAWIDRAGIELRGGGLDESPDCYKRLDEVLASVEDSVKILHRLTPVGVAMASSTERDPYKD